MLVLFAATALSSAPFARADDQEEPDSFDLLGYFPTKDLSGRVRPYQLRLSLLYGPVTYSSVNAASDAKVEVPDYQQGFRIESDRWFQTGDGNRRTLGVSADVQSLFVNKFDTPQGPPIRYTQGSLLFGLRLWGYGHSQPWVSEGSLLVGAALESFPSMKVNFSLTGYTLANPLVLGGRAGIRMRFPIIPRFGLLSLETAAFVTTPLTIISGGGTVSRSDTQSIGANAMLDFKLFTGVILGAGGYLGYFKLKYTAQGQSVADRVEFITTSALLSLRTAF
jgi:hypothetical protein